MPPLKHIEDHLAAVVITGQWCCWKLPNKPDGAGYVIITLERRRHLAHRVIYERLIGPIPRGLTLDHLCRNRWCCNPNHVEPATMRVNLLRGETLAAQNARKMKCPRGHLLDSRNTYIYRGARACRTCRRDACKRYRKNI